jgi:mRNA-degrading endonuclease RelE of RelBE toxin-antitoxin system
MEDTSVPPFRFYSKFFTNDCHELPSNVREKLFEFLQKLQQNPDSPSIPNQSQGGFFAAEFNDGYVVYWKLQRGDIVSGPISHPAVKRIDVLRIAKTRDLR